MAGQISFCKHAGKCGLWILEFEFQHSISFNTGVKLQRLLGHIEFVNVSFYYPSRPMNTFKLNLLLRLHEPTNGEILVDGFSIRKLDIRWLRERVGFVGQGILQAFRNDVKASRTVIIIAHRLSTVEFADRIVVMDGGQIIEMGDHVELLLKDGLYAQLFKLQTDTFI